MNSGFLLVDKPAGITSHDVVDELRKITGIKKIGHAGTLDPFATGLLIMAVGREATREISKFVKLDKTYDAKFVLGATTDTLDSETPVVRSDEPLDISKADLEATLKALTGELAQIPPQHAAIKVKGKKMYELARRGEKVEVSPRTVTVHKMELITDPAEEDGLMTFNVHIACSSGTYIRALARDVAEALKTTGYVQELRRTSIGSAHIQDAVALKDLNSANWTEYLRNANLEL